MSSYFDALLRSAGSPLTASPSPMPAVAPASDAAEMPEPELTVETLAVPPAGPPVTPAVSPSVARAGEPRPRVSDPAAVEDAPGSHGLVDQDQSVRPRDPEMLAPPVTPATLAEQADLHPVVRAALRWVTADPVVNGREDSRAGTPAAAAPVVSRAESRPARTLPPAVDRESVREADRTDDGVTEQTAPVATARQSPTGFDLDLTWPVQPRPPRPTRTEGLDTAAAEQPEPVEIHIGTIHVAVDAPAGPRATVQPRVPSPTPPVRAASRSGFGRSRLPRL